MYPGKTPDLSAEDVDGTRREIEDLRGRLRDAEARVLQRELANREREATVRERESTIAELGETIAALKSASRDPRFSRFAGLRPWIVPGTSVDRTALLPLMTALMPMLEGWCTVRKACLLAELVMDSDAKLVGEIGVYGGRSLIPMALAMRGRTGAAAYGIEPWSNSVAVETPTFQANDDWWTRLDFGAIKRGFVDALVELDILSVVKLVEMSSDEAHAAFAFRNRPFDLLHIDGSHSTEQAMADVRRWLPLVRSGGIVVLDDILWDSVRPARDLLVETASIIVEVAENPDGPDPSYGAYRLP